MVILANDIVFLTSGYSGVWAYIKLILVFIFILLLAYYGAKLAGNYQNNVLNNKSNIKIIESYRIGGNKLIAIAKIGEDYYAIGIGKDEITLIDKLDASYFDALENERNSGGSKGFLSAEQKVSFKDILSKFKDEKKSSGESDDDERQ
jgi:flagellar protein FliO/FliZ